MKDVIAIERGYYGGKIQEPGDQFKITSEKHLGAWMEPQGWKPEKAKVQPVLAQSAGQPGGEGVAYSAKFNGGTRWRVVDAAGAWFSDFVGASKEEAQAEADRLNAGGQPVVKPAEQSGGEGGDTDEDGHPDA